MCTTVEEIPNVQFRWYKNGSPLAASESDSRVRLRTFPDVSTLVIGPLEEGDSGNYTCTGTARSRSDSHTEVLSVLGELVQTTLHNSSSCFPALKKGKES